MWNTIKEVAPVVSDVATALAFCVVALQLWLIGRQSSIDAHFNFLKSERDLWLAALQHQHIAPKLIAATWSDTSDGKSSDELFLIMLTDNYWHAWVRYRSGQTPAKSWAPFERSIVKVLSAEPANTIWEAIKAMYPADFVSHFDRLLQAPRRA